MKNKYSKTVCRVGYIGEGSYRSVINYKITPQYRTWSNMLMRCYSEKYQSKHPTYLNCTVAEEWHNFQNFAKWYDENYYEVDGQKMCLDKDILIDNNKVYSPETCVFVPQNINKLFIISNILDNNLPKGVSFDKANNKYISFCNKGNGKQKNLGRFNTPEEAFCAYKTYKEKLIIDIAEKYKHVIPNRLYQSMINIKIHK